MRVRDGAEDLSSATVSGAKSTEVKKEAESDVVGHRSGLCECSKGGLPRLDAITTKIVRIAHAEQAANRDPTNLSSMVKDCYQTSRRTCKADHRRCEYGSLLPKREVALAISIPSFLPSSMLLQKSDLESTMANIALPILAQPRIAC